MTLARQFLPTNLMRSHANEENSDVQGTADRFVDRFSGKDATVEKRKASATSLVNEYYDMVTDLYEYGWGQAFHFAPRYVGETVPESFARYEYYLASRGQFKAGDNVIDMGCGVGGPLRNIVRLTQCKITGVNNNAYQISRAKRYDEKYGLQAHTSYVRTDFNNMPFEDNSKDGAYAIEAICHSRDKLTSYKECFRVLKPGARLVSYEWALTDKCDKTNPTHKEIIAQVELGNALPELETIAAIVKQLKEAGFIVEDAHDVGERFEASELTTIPWYDPLTPSYTSLFGLRTTPMGRWVTTNMLRGMEKLRLCPKGAVAAADILEEAAVGLVRSGEIGIFTPALFLCARKPFPGEKVE